MSDIAALPKDQKIFPLNLLISEVYSFANAVYRYGNEKNVRII